MIPSESEGEEEDTKTVFSQQERGMNLEVLRSSMVTMKIVVLNSLIQRSATRRQNVSAMLR